MAAGDERGLASWPMVRDRPTQSAVADLRINNAISGNPRSVAAPHHEGVSVEAMKIRLAENFRAIFYAPFYATQALGFYEREGVDIDFVARRFRQCGGGCSTAAST